ncbi:MAG TPA: hypothetical protein VGD71_44845 [Kribbella sp.]
MTRTVLVAGAAAWLLAGCSSSDDSGVGTPASTSTATTVSAPSGSPSSAPATSTTPPTVTPTVTPTKTAPALPKAADGNNLKGSDARCEVYVRTGSKIPVSRSVAGFNTLVVSKVATDGVDFGGSTPNTSVSAGGQRAGSTSQLNDLQITTVAIQGETAILRLRPA